MKKLVEKMINAKKEFNEKHPIGAAVVHGVWTSVVTVASVITIGKAASDFLGANEVVETGDAVEALQDIVEDIGGTEV